METLNFKLNGLSPLLMHNPSGLMQPRVETLGRKQVPTPEDEAANSRYLLPDGNLYVPSIAVRNCLLNGAKGYKVGKKGAIAVLSGAILMIDETFPLSRNNTPIDGNDVSIDIRRAVIQRQGIPRARARVELPWQLDCAFGFSSELFANKDDGIAFIQQVLNIAGQAVGLLDYRVEKKGWFGRFEVASIEVI